MGFGSVPLCPSGSGSFAFRSTCKFIKIIEGQTEKIIFISELGRHIVKTEQFDGSETLTKLLDLVNLGIPPFMSLILSRLRPQGLAIDRRPYFFSKTTWLLYNPVATKSFFSIGTLNLQSW